MSRSFSDLYGLRAQNHRSKNVMCLTKHGQAVKVGSSGSEPTQRADSCAHTYTPVYKNVFQEQQD
jgi:hypothetical protein